MGAGAGPDFFSGYQVIHYYYATVLFVSLNFFICNIVSEHVGRCKGGGSLKESSRKS